MNLAEAGYLLGARAAGTWRVGEAELALTEFWAAADLDVRVAEDFRSATLCVAMSRLDLGIVRAALDARPTVSIASDVPSDIGSGMWLRCFGAVHSVAVPRIVGGVVVEVASVALCDSRDDEAIRLLGVVLNR